MSQVECISPLSDEHYKAIVAVSKDLTSIIQKTNGCQSSRVKATDSLCKLVELLGLVQVNPISGSEVK